MFQSYRRQAPEISLSALVDVLFILVVFVILAANFDRPRAIDVTLPAGGVESTAPEDVLVVVLAANGSVRVQQTEVAEQELEAHLRAHRQHASSLILAADRGVSIERATEILTLAQRAGFDTVSIATRRGSAQEDPKERTDGRTDEWIAPKTTEGAKTTEGDR